MVNLNNNAINKFDIIRFYDKLLPLLITCMPGLYRLAILFIFSHFLVNNSNSTINAYVFSTGICIFTSLGFALNIVKDISGETDKSIVNKKYTENFLCIILLSTLSIVALLLSGLIDKEEIKNIYLLVVSLGLYQFERNYLLGKNYLSYIFILDLFLLLITTAMIWNNMDGVFSLCIANLTAVLISLIISKRTPVLSFEWKVFSSGITLGYINLVSGGIMYILPQIMSSIASDNTVTIMSMAVAVSGIAIIFPRALLNANIAKIAEKIKTNNFTKIEYKILNKKVKIICCVLFPISLVASLFYIFISGVILTFEIEQVLIISCITLVVISAQLSIIDSVVLIFSNNERIALIANTIIFFIIMGVYISINYSILTVINNGYYFILLSLFFLYLIRYFVFKRAVVNELY